MHLRYLDDLSRDELHAWLREALHDRRPLPKLTHDEPPDVALLRAEPTLDRIARRDLMDACVTLVQDFSASPEDDEDYLRALLGLAVGLDLRDRVSPLLYVMGTRTPEFERLPWNIQRVLLEGLINLRSLQTPDFWHAHFERAPAEFALTALAGLLDTAWSAGIEFLPRLADAEALAFAAATLIEQKLEDVPPAERDRFTRELSNILSPCNAALREAIGAVVGQHALPTPAAPPRKTSHTMPPRRDPRLAEACLNLGIRPYDRQRCARLVEPDAIKDAA